MPIRILTDCFPPKPLVRKIANATFQYFPQLSELNLSLNEICHLPRLQFAFNNLKILDLSYNFINGEATILQLGLLPNLVKLSLSGNGLNKLPRDMAEPEVSGGNNVQQRFENLQILHMDDNKLCAVEDLASLATLPRLCILNLAYNNFRSIPLLKSINAGSALEYPLTSTVKVDERESNRAKLDESPMGNVKGRHSASILKPFDLKDMSGFGSSGEETNDQSISIAGQKLRLSKPSRSKRSGNRNESSPVKMNESTYVASTTDGNNDRKPRLNSPELVTPASRQLSNLAYERRNPMAPRIRLVDEFCSQAAIQRVFHLRRRGQTPRSSKTHHRPMSNLKTYRSGLGKRSRRSLVSKGFGQAKKGLSPIGSVESPAMLAMTALKEATKTAFTVPPFPSLRLIDLSHNQILYEEHVLPVAVWPQLKEIAIHNNPVVTRHSGMPPLLERLLVRRLRMNVRRSSDAASWSDTVNELVVQPDSDSHHGGSQCSDTSHASQLALPAPLSVLSPAMSCKQLFNAAQSRMRHQRLSKPNARAPVVVPNRLTSKQLSNGPKIGRCEPEQLIRDLRMESNRSKQPQLTGSPSGQSTTIVSSTASPVPEALRMNGKADTLEALLPKFSIDRSTVPRITSTSSGSTTQASGDVEIEPQETFFTTQEPGLTADATRFGYEKVSTHVASQMTLLPCSEENKVIPSGRLPSPLSRPTGSREHGKPARTNEPFMTSLLAQCLGRRPELLFRRIDQLAHLDDRAHTPSHNHDDDDSTMRSVTEDSSKSGEPDDEQLTDPISPGPILPNLPWIVEEEQLPENMQACLQELRHWCQHRPTIHAQMPPLLSTPLDGSTNNKFLTPSLQAQLDELHITKHEGTETGKRQSREAALEWKTKHPLQIPLTKIMEVTDEPGSSKSHPSTDGVVHTSTSSPQTSISSKRESKRTARMAKQTFKQFQQEHTKLCGQLLQEATSSVDANYERLAREVHQEIIESLDRAGLPKLPADSSCNLRAANMTGLFTDT